MWTGAGELDRKSWELLGEVKSDLERGRWWAVWCSWVLIVHLFPSTPTRPHPTMQSGMLVPGSPGLGKAWGWGGDGGAAGIRWPEVQACTSAPSGQSPPLSGTQESSAPSPGVI